VRPEKINDVTVAGLLLLLLILLMNVLKSAFSLAGHECDVVIKGVFIHVSGDIKQPGIYGFYRPPSLRDVLAKAGVPRLGSDKAMQFKDTFLSSGKKIEILAEGKGIDIFESEMSAFHKITIGVPISVNRETVEGLTAVPGIGPRIAGEIVRERDKRGGFKRLDEILSVQGIGPVLFKKIRPYMVL
jgi:competence protein ComEA